MNKPRPYDMDKPEEFTRLMRETLEYMKVSRHHGTDGEGREHAIDALSFLVTNSKQLI